MKSFKEYKLAESEVSLDTIRDNKIVSKVEKILGEKRKAVHETSFGIIVEFNTANNNSRLTGLQLKQLSQAKVRWYETNNNGNHTVGLD